MPLVVLSGGSSANIRSMDVEYYSEKGRKWIRRKGKTRALSMAQNYLKISLKVNGKEKTHNVHKLVSDAFNGIAQPGMEVDHIDSNKLNNRADNLRLITRKQNRLRSVWGKVKLQGVYFRKANTHRPYCSSIMINGHRIELGAFATPEEAHEAYKAALMAHYPNGLEYVSYLSEKIVS